MKWIRTLRRLAMHPVRKSATERALWSLRIVRDLSAYFRNAEYPMGRFESWREAFKMRRSGWPDA